MQVLGLTDSAVRSFVQEHDPIPRVLLTSDPTYHALVNEPQMFLLCTKYDAATESTAASSE